MEIDSICIKLNEKTLKNLIFKYIQEKMGSMDISVNDIKIEVKSAQNYKSEWEKAEYRAVYEKSNF